MLFINGRQSNQWEIENDVKFYKHVFPYATSEQLKFLDGSHAVHFDCQQECIDLLREWLQRF